MKFDLFKIFVCTALDLFGCVLSEKTISMYFFKRFQLLWEFYYALVIQACFSPYKCIIKEKL